MRKVDLGDRRIEFAVDPQQSFFGDCIRVVNAPDEPPVDPQLPPFGWSKPQMLGGFAMTSSALSGFVSVNFRTKDEEFTSLDLDHCGGLNGTDSWLAAPDGYLIESNDNVVTDALPRSHGMLERRSGRIFDFHYNVMFSNSAIDLLKIVNPNLTPPPLLFPGLPYAGHAMGWIEIAQSGQLIFRIAAEQFLPLGPRAGSAPIVFPASQSGGDLLPHVILRCIHLFS